MPFQYDEVADQTEKVRLTGTFTDDQGTPVTPGTPVSLQVKPPNGVWAEEAASVPEAFTGVFQYDYVGDGTGQGLYLYKFLSADGGIEDGSFEVVRV